MCMAEEDEIFVNLGGTAGVALVPKAGIRAFFNVADKRYTVMKLDRRWRLKMRNAKCGMIAQIKL